MFVEVCAMLREITLALIVSLDTYLAAAAYSGSRIRIPALSAGVISLVCAAVLGVSLALSDWLSELVPAALCRRLGVAIMTSIGAVIIMKSVIRTLLRRFSDKGTFSLKIGEFCLAVRLWLDETAADIDHSQTLSPTAAAALALASSLDSAAAGLSSGCSEIRPLSTALFTFIVGYIAIFAGSRTGSRLPAELSWLSGTLLILFAFFL
jgi:putative sporulation protein YtaF